MNKILPGVVLLILVVGGIAYFNLHSSSPAEVACTLEAKQCPDGSYVGRTGPNCEFAACPEATSTPPQAQKSGIHGTVLLGPICPVERIPPDPQCAPKPYATTLVLTTADQSKVLLQFSSDSEGKFTLQLQPGTYAIRSAAVANIRPYCANNETIVVKSNVYTDVAISCDTGIR